MLKKFNREDLDVRWSIVKARFKKTKPVNYMDNFLLLNLKTMFEHHVEDNVWKNQQGLVKVLNWKLYDSCGVHYVTMQKILYYLLVKKMYPLTNHTLHQMFNDVKLQVDYECEMAFELLRLVKKQLKEGYGRIVRIKSLLEVTAPQARILELKRRYLNITVLKTNTPYPSRKIRHICACTHQRPRRKQDPIRRWTTQTLLWKNTSGSRKKRLENVGKCLTGKLLSMVRSVYPDDQKSDKGNDENEIDMIQSSGDMAPLPPHDQRHLWLRYQVEGYTEEIVHDFEQRLKTIFGRQVNRVDILDFKGLTPDMRQDLVKRMRMEFLLEFFSTCRIGDEMGLDMAGTLCFQLGGARRSMMWRQFILALGGRHLKRHTERRKSGARLSGGHFIGRLAHHFGLVSDDGLRGLSVIARELSLIDMVIMEYLVNISKRHAFWSLNEDILKTNTPYPSRKIRRWMNRRLIWKIYIAQLEEEKSHRHGRVFNWKTATYGKIRVDDDLYDLRSKEAEFLAIVIDDTFTPQDALPCKSQVSIPVNDEIDFRISFDESDDEDYTIIYDKNLFSYKMISVNNLKTDSENDNEKAGIPSFPLPKPTTSYVDDLDFFKDFENEFPAIFYNDAQTSKSDLLTNPILSPKHIDEFNLNDETPVSEYDEEGQNIMYFDDLLPFNIIRPDDLKSEKDNNNNNIDIIQSSEGSKITHRSNTITDTIRDKIDKIFDEESFVLELNVNIGLEYSDADIADFKERLERIYNREIHRVQVVDFLGMPELMMDGLFARMVMEHRDDAGEARRRLIWRQFILALGLHTKEEMESLGFARTSAFLHFDQRSGVKTLPSVAQDAPAVDEGGQADPTLVQAPLPPPAPARTMPQRMARVEEDVHEIRGALTEQREVIDVMARDFSRFSTWAVTSLARMMDRAGVAYVPYSETHVPYQRRRVRQRTGEASTSAAQQDPQIKPGSKFSTIVHEYDTEPRRIFTLNARIGKRDDFKCVEAKDKFNLKTLL
ncbi:hypothetical protein Tco_0819493 [Tanacetum coccineum]|uniref:Uncharacterized protein n=1 Tax=Tanacetum coccineum TaxID=301880 RepID=A0ABQ5A8H3_9ASTR